MSFLDDREGRRTEARTSPEARNYMRASTGWHVIERGKGGTVAHRGVLHPDEYVDVMRVLVAVERQLGFSIADVWEAYGQGRKAAALLDLRDRIDARLLTIANAGGNVSALARILEVDDKTFSRAVVRARQSQKEAA